MKANSDTLRGKPGLSMLGLLLVEMIVAYEWLVSGVVKFVRGGLPSGLADELLEKSCARVVQENKRCLHQQFRS